jgi:hypothetical protein
MMVWSDTISFMLLTHGFFAGFTPKPIADAHATSEVLICLSRDSRADVDAITEAAAAAGGKADIRDRQDYGFMYGARSRIRTAILRADVDGRPAAMAGQPRLPPDRRALSAAQSQESTKCPSRS